MNILTHILSKANSFCSLPHGGGLGWGLLLLCLGWGCGLHAQVLRVWQGGNCTVVPVALAGEMQFGASGQTLTIGGTDYTVSAIDSITVSPAVVVLWNGATATVSVPETLAGITYSVKGANVSITSTNTTDEIEYVLQGQSGDGSLLYNGEYKCTFVMNGLELTSKTTCPVDIQCGKRIAVQLSAGTTNTLCDAAGGAHKATLYTKGHMEVGGAGTLNVKSLTKHGIATKEYLQLKRTTGAVNILAAASDGIHAGQYFQMNGGTLTITDNAGDAIQAEVTNDATDERNGEIIIKGGTITASATEDDTKVLKADTDITISGGTLTLTASGDGSRGIQTDGNLLFNEADGTTLVNIKATGDKYTDPATGEDSRCWGIKVKGNITRAAGTVNITATGKAKAYKADGLVTGM